MVSLSPRLGIVLPHVTLGELAPLAREIADLGYRDLWAGESDRYEASVPLALVAAVEPRLRLGTAVLPVFTRGRFLLAQIGQSLASASAGGFVLGLGASSPFIVSMWNGLEFDQPLRRVETTVAYLRERFAKAAGPTPPIYLGALGPRMMRLAGDLGDGIVLTCLGADDVATVLPDTHGEVVAWVSVAVVDDEADLDRALAIGRRRIGPYLQTPAYAAFHRRLGRATDPLTEAGLRELFIAGSAAHCRAELQRFHDNGVDTVLIEFAPGFGDLRRSLRALAPQPLA